MLADGNWKITINSPMGKQEGTLEVHTSGDSFTGKFSGQQGVQDVTGKVDGDNLNWSSQITTPFPMTLDFAAKVEGDKISGNVKAGSFGSFPFSGERA